VKLVSIDILRLHYSGELEDEDGNLTDGLVDHFFENNFSENDMDRLLFDVKTELSKRWKEVTFIDRRN
tara:strand:- start:127 stop:330 length:204 start_codon:yes stop_codon:yes gene_type:complete